MPFKKVNPELNYNTTSFTRKQSILPFYIEKWLGIN